MKRTYLIIHGFAILHATATYACRSFGMADELVLTMLTMIMVVLMPRDIAWSSLGELFVLSEKGELFRAGLDLGRKEVQSLDRLKTDLQDAWALFPSSRGDLYCLDVSASRLSKATMLPSKDTEQGFLGLYGPVLAQCHPHARTCGQT